MVKIQGALSLSERQERRCSYKLLDLQVKAPVLTGSYRKIKNRLALEELGVNKKGPPEGWPSDLRSQS